MLPPFAALLLALGGEETSRRRLIESAATSFVAIFPSTPSNANDLYLAQPMGVKSGKSNESVKPVKPSAPLEFLLPAARVGIYIYQTLSLAEDLNRLIRDGKDKGVTVGLLDNMLLTQPSFLQEADPTVKRSDEYHLPPVVGEVAVAAQKRKERRQQNIDAGFVPELFEVGQLVGERMEWNNLAKKEKVMEGSSQIRLALNIYTTNLNFDSNKYVYSGTKEEKSRLIREEKLPTARDVIRSDLDSRDLWRNALQTAMEDVRAEYIYQKRVGFEDVDELVGLLKDAQMSIDKWFSFIPDDDIKEALDAVRKEQKAKVT
ncbi:hypothetical protein THAOC_01396 [Thalassiosira oceanica]|uniref:Uncharacterized protein n=1 Tax=Thalassiosira oceanica TaxID=159749 RepID=K0TIG8_THAOC|nr:hypothetical protein THAOC_01396 [Thalassiosira oceanica]|mmetsp:Transcript_4545/g.10088  ORF Transcript_4545/g.10088 Transcript_4545/m.10088 type:complete len:317 (-) Transcript_4545:1065-2015(-)|eukprot:EJK76819.1 hypothetical protein THAOC_01396 [Thalassiosira oceanica]